MEFRDAEATGIFRRAPERRKARVRNGELLESWLGSELHTFRVRVQQL